MARPTISKIVKIKDLAAAGVDYSPRHGAICPWCGGRAKIIKTLPWEDKLRVRYHRCNAPGCVLASLHTTIKSVEADLSGVELAENER